MKLTKHNRIGLMTITMVCLCVVSIHVQAFAHGGEDHGSHGNAQPSAQHDELRFAAESEHFSAVIKLSNTVTDGQLAVTVCVSNTTTSAPVDDANIRLEIPGHADVRPTRQSSGVFVTSIRPLQAGRRVQAVLTIEANSTVDFVTFDRVVWTTHTVNSTQETAQTSQTSIRLAALRTFGTSFGLVLLGGIIGAFVTKRGQSPQK